MKDILKSIVVSVLTWEAKLVLKKYKPSIIAVTGSVGKTTTKDMIYHVLHDHISIRKNQKSFNSEIGVPLTILDLPNQWGSIGGWLSNIFKGFTLLLGNHDYPEWLVLEAGVDMPGDMQRLCSWLSPDIVVVTRFPDVPVHVEHFPTPDDVIAEKRNLVRALKENGVLIVNHDDAKTRSEIVREGQKKIMYGLEYGADVQATDCAIQYKDDSVPQGMQCRVTLQGRSVPVMLPDVVGEASVYAALAALAVGNELGVNLVWLIEALKNYTPAPGRMRLLPGVAGSTIIDDSYNSSPIALESSLKTLESITNTGRKIAVLGDMLELGEFTKSEHEKAGVQAAGMCNILMTVGIRAKDIARAAREKGLKEVMECRDANQAGMVLKEALQEGDVVLVKGSQSGIRLEKTVKFIMEQPERAHELLVRQEEEWQKK